MNITATKGGERRMLMILHPMSISQFLRLLLLIYSHYKIVGKRALSARQQWA